MRRRAVGAHLCASERRPGQGLPACVVCGGSAHLLAAFRRSHGAAGLGVSGSFGPVAVDTTDAEALISSQPAWSLPILGVNIVGNVCAVLFFLLFPSGRFAPRWMRWLAVAFCVYQVTGILVPELYSLLAFLGIVVSLVWSQIYSYRRFSTPAQRRQTKWVVFGTTLAVAGTFPFQLPVDLSLVGGDTPLALLLLRTGFSLSFLLVPLSISVAVLRSHLFDIDVLINRTLVYGSLTAMLIGLYFGGIVVLQRLFVALTGEKSTLAVVASTLAIAALFNPLRRRHPDVHRPPLLPEQVRRCEEARSVLCHASRRDGPRCFE